MKIVSFLNNYNREQVGVVTPRGVLDVGSLRKNLPISTLELLSNFEENYKKLKVVLEGLGSSDLQHFLEEKKVQLLSPIVRPSSLRDAYSFRQHVEASRKNRGLPMIPEFDEFPIYYYGNHQAVFGPGKISVQTAHLDELDFELEWAAVIGKRGKNIRIHEADDYIAGYTIMNDFSARSIQKKEMKLNLGPAKGKDFATALGPWFVTKDELEPYRTASKVGNQYDLEMKAFHNGKQVSSGTTKDMNWTFAQIIERCSYGTFLYPGDVIGSGTVGSGCYYENNFICEKQTWLYVGDTIELEVTGLGRLKNEIVTS